MMGGLINPGAAVHEIDWYFDFVSPYAYLASERLEHLPGPIHWRPRPILFAAILRHWNTLGPAEIAPMRRYTFRFVRYLADRDGIALRLPPQHPFNPLRLLRLCIVLDSDPGVVRRLFRFVWAEGRSSDAAADWRALTAELGVDDADQRIEQPAIKAQLRHNTERATGAGVFGVPAFVVDGEVFWGYDSLPFLGQYLGDPALLASPGMRAIDEMADGVRSRAEPGSSG